MDEQISNRIFVGGISWKADENSLREFFSQWGPVLDCKIIMDPITNKSKGYGFVTFEHKETAVDVKKATKLSFMGKTMNVGDAYRKSESQPKSRPPRQYTYPEYPSPVYQGGMYGYYPAVYSDQLYYHPPYYAYYYQSPVYYDHLYDYGVPYPQQMDQFNQPIAGSEYDQRGFGPHDHLPPTSPLTPQFQSLGYSDEGHPLTPQQHPPHAASPTTSSSSVSSSGSPGSSTTSSSSGTPPLPRTSPSSSSPTTGRSGAPYSNFHNRGYKKDGYYHHSPSEDGSNNHKKNYNHHNQSVSSAQNSSPKTMSKSNQKEDNKSNNRSPKNHNNNRNNNNN